MSNVKKLGLLFSLLQVLFTTQIIAGGFIVVEDKKIRCNDCPAIQQYTIEQKSEKIDVEINNLVAVTNIDQTFYNPHNRKLEGDFLFPVPQGVELKSFMLWVNGVQMGTDQYHVEKARQMYHAFVQRQGDPTLLEYCGQPLYMVKLPPIFPNATTTIKIAYSEELTDKDGLVEYNYPLNIQKNNPTPLNMSIKADIKSDVAIKNVYSPTFQLETARPDDMSALIGFEKEAFIPKEDFKLYYSTNPEELASSVMNYRVGNLEDGYFYLNIGSAMQTEELQVLAKDITFVLDCSGSMSGEKMEQAKRALRYCVNSLNENDHFNLVRFSTEAEALFSELQPIDEDNIQRANMYIDGLVARGGTNIDEALDIALNIESDAKRPYMIVFITDGKPTIGVTQELDLLESVKRNNRSNAKIFTFGIGEDLNAHLLDNITDLTKAYGTYVETGEDIEFKLSSFYNKVSSPILTDLTLNINGVKTKDVYPMVLPDLFQGNPLVVLGRYENWGPAQVILEGQMNGESQQFVFDVEFVKEAEEKDFIAPLWAARKIGHTLEQTRTEDNVQATEYLVDLSKQHGIITPYTSHFIMENEAFTEVPDAELKPKNNPIHLFTEPEEKLALQERFAKAHNAFKKKKEGAYSVQASRELNNMNTAISVSEITPGQDRLSFTNEKGEVHNIANDIRKVNGKTFYKINGIWTDIDLEDAPQSSKTKTFQFSSEKYYRLLIERPQLSKYLALGQEVQFFYRGFIYKVSK